MVRCISEEKTEPGKRRKNPSVQDLKAYGYDSKEWTAIYDDLTKEDSKKIGDVYSKSENRERNRELGASLLRMGYGITKISGANIANFGNPNSGIADEEINTFDDYNVLSKQTISNIGDTIIREITPL